MRKMTIVMMLTSGIALLLACSGFVTEAQTMGAFNPSIA